MSAGTRRHLDIFIVSSIITYFVSLMLWNSILLDVSGLHTNQENETQFGSSHSLLDIAGDNHERYASIYLVPLQ